MFPGSEDVYKAWSFVWYAWFVLRLQRVASVAFGREILALRKTHTSVAFGREILALRKAHTYRPADVVQP